MADQALHDLTPAYALDALDAHERDAYEQHLATCEQCRTELEAMQRTASSLAYAVVSPAPPPALRERIVEEARRERGNVVPFRPRGLTTYALGGLAAAAAAVAVAVGLWASSVSDQLDRERSVVEILADPQARSLSMEGGNGRVVVTDTGEAALVVSGIAAAPTGKTYEIWVLDGERALPAGLFEGRAGRNVVRLTRPVPAGGRVAVTLEPDGGVDQPTSEPLMVTRA